MKIFADRISFNLLFYEIFPMCKKLNNIIDCLVFTPQLKKENISDVMEIFRVPAQTFCITNSAVLPCISLWVRAGITSFFLERPGSEYFRLCRPCGLCCNYLTLVCENNYRKDVNKRADLALVRLNLAHES